MGSALQQTYLSVAAASASLKDRNYLPKMRAPVSACQIQKEIRILRDWVTSCGIRGGTVVQRRRHRSRLCAYGQVGAYLDRPAY